MRRGKGMEKICKIVYFDEESITDYVQIVAGGELTNTMELLSSQDLKEEQSARINGKTGISGVFKALLGWEAAATGEIAGGISFNNNRMARNIVKNTILTDFLKTLEESSDLKKGVSKLPQGTIKKFKGYKIKVEKDSLSYMVMLSPYLSMLKNESSISAGQFDIAIDKLDNTLKKAKGYYEFLGIKGNSKIILRFNINSFKNGYTISDLLKMDLSIYAIKVGRTSIDNLNISKELGVEIEMPSKENPSYEDNLESEVAFIGKELNVFDVLLAGVEADD